MTFPVLSGHGLSSLASGTNLTVNLPASIAANDLLIMVGAINGSPTVTTPTGFTDLLNDSAGTYVGYKWATGSEGATIGVTLGTAAASAWVVDRITLADPLTNPVLVSVTVSASATFDPPSNTSGFGAVDTLWLAIASEKGNIVTVSTAPTSYTLDVNEAGGNKSNAIVYWRQNNTATENPSAYTLSTTGSGRAITIAIKPITTTAYTLTAAVGTFTYTGNAATLAHNMFLTAAKGAYAYTGIAATLAHNLFLVAAKGVYAYTGQSVVFNRAMHLIAATGAYTYTGFAAFVGFSTHYLLTAATGAYSYVGQSIVFNRAMHLIAATGSYLYTGWAPVAFMGRVAVAVAKRVQSQLAQLRAQDASLSLSRGVSSALTQLRSQNPALAARRAAGAVLTKLRSFDSKLGD